MKLIALSEVVVAPNRQRRSFPADKMQEFSDNLARTRLQNPIVLRRDWTSTQLSLMSCVGHETFILVSGERRLRAVSDLADLGTQIRHDGELVPLGFIPYTLTEDLTPLELEEAELDENIHRADLTWQERASAHARLAALRKAQAASLGLPAPTTADITLEVRGSSSGSAGETTRRELILADHLGDPEVAAAKTVDEGWKVLKRKEDVQRSRDLANRVGLTFTAEQHRAICADSLVWLAQAPAETWDVILTDTPYGMGADEFGDSGGLAQGAHGYEDTLDNFEKLLVVCGVHLFRIAKPQAHLYWFCDIDNFHVSKLAFQAAGWWVFRTPLIWHKPSAMRAPWPEHGPQRKWECLLYAVKGKRPALRIAPDLFAYPPDVNLGHAAQKPVALFEDLLRRSVRAGDTVLDPFCGSGPVFPAAHALKCAATGVEIDPASYGLAVKRIEGLKQQLELPV